MARKPATGAAAVEAADLGQGPAESFPNRLSGPVGAAGLPGAGRCWPRLVLFCLAMQLWTASRWHVIWPDTVDYLRVSQALDRGDPRPLADQFGLNLYPLVLVLLHRAGLDWLWAGQCWSMAMASLVVLPLLGWLRRQFDDRVALVGCLLYALHPKLMIHGPLIIRDPTFWFLLVLTLYLGWRAVLELKPWLFCAAGRGLGLGRPHPHGRLAVGGAAGIVVRFSLAGRRGASAAAGAGGAAVRGHAPGLGPLDERHLAARLSALGADPPRPRGNDPGLAAGARRFRAARRAPRRRPRRHAPPPRRIALADRRGYHPESGRSHRQGVHLCLRIPGALGIVALAARLFPPRPTGDGSLPRAPVVADRGASRAGMESDDRYYLPSVIVLSGYAALGLWPSRSGSCG